MRKKLWFGLMLVALALFATGCGNEVAFDWEKGELIVGLECSYPPYNWTESAPSETNYPISNRVNAYAEGYDVQIAKMIAEELNLTLVIREVEWDSLIIEITTGRIDCVIAGMSPTEDRKEVIDFTTPYYVNKHVVLLPTSSAYASATTLAELTGITVAGQSGTIYDILAQQLADKAGGTYATPLESVSEVINAIMMNRLDATVVEEVVAIDAVAKNAELTYIFLDDVFEVTEADCAVSIGTRLVDNDLTSRINDALAKISNSVRDDLMHRAIGLS